jgi:hypothetical protein
MALERPHDSYMKSISKGRGMLSQCRIISILEGVSVRIFRIKNAHIKLRQGSKNIRSGNEDAFILL